MKQSFWKADWFLGLLIALAFLFAARSNLPQSLERKAYDLGVQAPSRTPGGLIAVIAIDDKILQEQPEQRFQTGADWARAIRACAGQIPAAREK